MLIDAFKNIEFRDKDKLFNIVGDGVDKAKLIKMSKKFNLGENNFFLDENNDEKMNFMIKQMLFSLYHKIIKLWKGVY